MLPSGAQHKNTTQVVHYKCVTLDRTISALDRGTLISINLIVTFIVPFSIVASSYLAIYIALPQQMQRLSLDLDNQNRLQWKLLRKRTQVSGILKKTIFTIFSGCTDHLCDCDNIRHLLGAN